MKRRVLGVLIALLTVIGVCAQPSLKKVQVHLVPDHEDAIYKLGEQAKFKVIALDCGLMLSNIDVNYEVSEDMMPAHVKKSIRLKGNEGVIQAGTMKEPGYLRVKATVEHEGTKYTSYSTVGFAPEKLMPWMPISSTIAPLAAHATFPLMACTPAPGTRRMAGYLPSAFGMVSTPYMRVPLMFP